MSVGILDSLFDLIGDTMVFVIGGTVALGFFSGNTFWNLFNYKRYDLW